VAFQRIALLSIGEMGYHWASLLRSHGVELLGYLRGRSEVTRRRAENAGVKSVATLSGLVAKADLIVSLVVPSAARRVAVKVARALAQVPRRDLIYLEANAISPMTVSAISRLFGHDQFVDGCIIGSAAKLSRGAVLYVSGPQAERIRELERFGFAVRVLGPDIGQASAFKIVYAGFTKGLQGLLVELLLGARKLGMLGEILARYEESFPGLPGKIGQTIAALPLHAGRRAEEMAELRQTFRHHGLRPLVTPSVEKILKAIGALKAGKASETGAREGSLIETIELLFQAGLLQESEKKSDGMSGGVTKIESDIRRGG